MAISLERYYAICHPLTSRRWQTRSHAYRIIAAVWVLALSVMIPTAVYQKLPKLRSGAHKCMEIWDDLTLEKVKGWIYMLRYHHQLASMITSQEANVIDI